MRLINLSNSKGDKQNPEILAALPGYSAKPLPYSKIRNHYYPAATAYWWNISISNICEKGILWGSMTDDCHGVSQLQKLTTASTAQQD